MQCLQAIADSDTVFRFAISGKLPLKGFDFWPKNKLAGVQYPVVGRIQLDEFLGALPEGSEKALFDHPAWRLPKRIQVKLS